MGLLKPKNAVWTGNMLARAKRVLRGAIQRTVRAVNSALGRNAKPAKIRRFSAPGMHTFFGYYDVCPEATDGRVLAHLVDQDVLQPGEAECRICVFEQDNDWEAREIGRSKLWSWQLGTRLQWLAGDAGSIIYNTMVDGGPGAVVVDPKSGENLLTLDKCFFDVAKCGSFALGLDFERLAWARPGYGYPALSATRPKTLIPEDGIYRIDLSSGQSTPLLSMDDIIGFDPQPEFEDSFHYLNHLSICPSGQRFFFLHIWLPSPDNKLNWKARAFTADCNGDNLWLLNQKGVSSHYNWRSDEELVLFRQSEGGSGYVSFIDTVGEHGLLADHLPQIDGHQSFTKDARFMLTDTYPRRFSGEQELLLCDLDGGSIERVAHFQPHPSSVGDRRCDLHPRFSRDEKRVFVDSTHEGLRSLYEVTI